MKNVDACLIICGDGNFLSEAKSLTAKNQLQDKIFFKGKMLPADLEKITRESYIGINLVEPLGKNQFLSLANKFFDYIQNAIPQITMNFPEYRKINEQFEIAVLIDDLSFASIEKSLTLLLEDKELYFRLKQNCFKAREVYNWQNEERKLIDFYSQF